MTAVEYLARAQSAYAAKAYGEALAIIADAEADGKACPDCLLLKGACVQLAAETDFPAEHALEVYDDLLATQPHNARAWLEKAFFLLKVSDDPKRANPCFAEAARMFGELLETTLVGLAQSATESGTSQPAALGDVETRLGEILGRIRKRLHSA
jgi:hypothetical protein